MIPLKDYNPTRRRAYATLLLIGVCVVIYFFVQPGGEGVLLRRSESSQQIAQRDTEFSFAHAAIPCEITRDRPLSVGDLETDSCLSQPQGGEIFPHKSVYLAILYSMFLHGSILHIAGNMLFLWVFGNNIEDRLGPVPYVGFYLVAGVAATMAHVLMQPHSITPLVGASGAIAGVMGFYLVLFPNVRIKSLIFIPPIIFWRDISAKWLLLLWLGSQFILSPGSGVAWVAHVGGFVFGALVALIWRTISGPPKPRIVAAPTPPWS
jgi:membrane associated rhomboid family serine protease